ncbi:MAG: hypothetical protein HGA65_14530 [Oscillochloris sp.]|nr:hypothetical protein [Oscillochloris sp.]
MSTHTSIDQAQQRVTALRQEAARLADQAKEQLLEYVRLGERTLATQTTQAQSAAHSGRVKLKQATSHASDQVANAVATALEDAAGQLHTVTGDGPAAQATHQVAVALEHGSDYLQPWGTRAVLRRLKRVARSAALPALLVTVVVVGAVALAKRGKPVAH